MSFKSKPKVLVIGARAVPDFQGGIEKQVEVLYPLIAEEFEIHIAVMRKYQRHSTWKHAKIIAFPSFPFKRAEKVFYSLFASIYAFVRKYDVVHVQGIGAALFLPLIKLRKHTKIILHYRSQDYTYPKWGKLGKKILKLAEKIGVKNADVVIVVAKRYRHHLYDSYKHPRILYVPNVLVISKQKDLSVLYHYGLKRQSYVLSVGRITPEKRFEMLIEAYKRSSLPKKGIRLVIVGGKDDSAYYKKLKSLADENIIFTDSLPRKQLNALYANAYMFVLPSSHEGTPNVVLEAMSFNIPVYVSDIEAHRELMLNSKMYFSTVDELVRILNNKPLVLYDSAFLDLYHPQEVAGKISEIFKKLLKED